MEVYLIRHTETVLPKGVCYGQSDILLQEPYLEKFDKIVKSVKYKNAVIYSSPLKRCTFLAEHFRKNNDNYPPIITDDRLMEMNFGDWEMKEWNNIDPDMMKKWMVDFVDEKVPNGESFTELDARVANFIENELLKCKKEVAIIITHAGVIRSFLCKAMNLPLKEAFRNDVAYGSVKIVEVYQTNLELRKSS